MITILPNWHPIFVHFTVALLIVAAAMHVVSHFVSDTGLKNQLTITARWNLWIGIAFTVLTVAAGWYAFNTVTHDAPSHLAMIEHRNWALITFAVLLGIAAWEVYLYRHRKGKSWLFTSLLVLAASLLLSTAWHGGELVYRYGLGVMSMPKPEGTKADGSGHANHQMEESAQDGDSTMDSHTHDQGSVSAPPTSPPTLHSRDEN